MSQLVGLSKFCGERNHGGLIHIRYAPTDWIFADAFEDMVSLSNYSVFNHIIFSQGNWLDAYLLPNSKSWTETQRSSKQGPNYQEVIKGVLPKMKPSIHGEFAAMAHRNFLVLLTDENGQDWLPGTLEHPFEFKVKGRTGSEISNLNNYQIEFTCKCPKMAAGYAPVF